MATHGTRNMYANYHCRCDPCRAASSEYERTRRYADINASREKEREKSKEWATKNKNKIVLYSRISRERGKERIQAYNRHWNATHKEKRVEYERNRRARHAGAAGRCDAIQLAQRVQYYGNQCYVCKGPNQAIDHVKPLARGGSNWPANLRPICRSCNSKKHAKVIRPSELIRILTY